MAYPPGAIFNAASTVDPREPLESVVREFTAWAKYPHSYHEWFVKAEADVDAIKVWYNPGKISPAELALHSSSKFMGYPVHMVVEPGSVYPVEKPKNTAAAMTMHDCRCPNCGTPCHRCHGK